MLIEIVSLIMIFTQFMDNSGLFSGQQLWNYTPACCWCHREQRGVGDKCEQESFVTDPYILGLQSKPGNTVLCLTCPNAKWVSSVPIPGARDSLSRMKVS
jgi:hypothetical protein